MQLLLWWTNFPSVYTFAYAHGSCLRDAKIMHHNEEDTMLYSPKIFFLISSSLYDIKLSKTSFNSILPIVEGPNFPPLFPLFSFFICKPCIACDTNGHRQDASHVTTRLAFEKTTISSVLFFSSNYLGTSLTLQTFHHLLHSGQTSDNVDPECSI